MSSSTAWKYTARASVTNKIQNESGAWGLQPQLLGGEGRKSAGVRPTWDTATKKSGQLSEPPPFSKQKRFGDVAQWWRLTLPSFSSAEKGLGGGKGEWSWEQLWTKYAMSSLFTGKLCILIVTRKGKLCSGIGQEEEIGERDTAAPNAEWTTRRLWCENWLDLKARETV